MLFNLSSTTQDRSFSVPAYRRPVAAAALAALQVMRQEPEHAARVNLIASKMRKAFQEMGFNTGNSATPIIPIIIGDTQRAFVMWKLLFQNGIFVNVAIPPAVLEGRQLLRTSFMASHTEEQLNQVLKTFETVGKQVGLIK